MGLKEKIEYLVEELGYDPSKEILNYLNTKEGNLKSAILDGAAEFERNSGSKIKMNAITRKINNTNKKLEEVENERSAFENDGIVPKGVIKIITKRH